MAIVALTNATPSGVPEALNAQFADLVQFGEVREDWYSLYQGLLTPLEKPVGSLVGQKPPANPTPSAPLASYVGTYNNDYWGPARVSQKDGNLHLELGSKLSVPLINWDGDVFTYEWVSENSPPGSVGKATFDGRQADVGVLRRYGQGDVHPMTIAIAAGLSDAEVAQRVAEGKTNDVPTRAARSVSEIVRANVFTRINAILGVLLIIVLSTGSVINGAFGLLIIANSAIGIIQELRAKQTLDKLAIVGQAKPTVRRQSGTEARPPSEVVLDDIIELGPGDQIVVDGDIVEETNLEVDESLLTGEADPIAKDAGDRVMSGSFVVAGSGAYRATKVGREAYAAQLAEEASKFTLVKSELRVGINKILQFITYLLVPAGLLIIYTQLFTTDAGWRESVLRMVGALVPMVPEGLVLMTSIAFAVGVIRLGRRQCLVNELPAIEGLARVDVVCADKTGTLTENGMRVSDLQQLDEGDVGNVLAQMAADDPRPNASMQAIGEAYKMPPGWTATASAPFKSATKWSGTSYGDNGNWVIGAPDVLLDPASPAAEQAERIGSQGLRVLLLGSSDLPVDDQEAPGTVTPVALVVLEQRVRPDARETLDYFASQKVSIKVISGDNAVSVGAVAGSLGLEGETMDARQLPDGPETTRRHTRRVHHLRPGAAGSEARDGPCAAVARAHRRDDR